MRNTIKMALAGFAMMATGSTGVLAAEQAHVVTYNNSSSSVWITYYDLGKNQFATACVTSHNTQNQNFSWGDVATSGGVVYLRFEYKQNTNCGGKTLYDSHYGGAYRMPALGHTLTADIPNR